MTERQRKGFDGGGGLHPPLKTIVTYMTQQLTIIYNFRFFLNVPGILFNVGSFQVVYQFEQNKKNINYTFLFHRAANCLHQSVLLVDDKKSDHCYSNYRVAQLCYFLNVF